MGKLGSVAAAAGGIGLLGLALAGWTRQPATQGTRAFTVESAPPYGFTTAILLVASEVT